MGVQVPPPTLLASSLRRSGRCVWLSILTFTADSDWSFWLSGGARRDHGGADSARPQRCHERELLRGTRGGALPVQARFSVASSSIAAQALVDYLQLVIFPVTGGSGPDRIFANWPDLDLEPVTARGFDGRMQLPEYVPTLHRIGPLPAFWCD